MHRRRREITVDMDDDRPQGRIPPQDLDAEMSFLGALLLEPKASHEIIGTLKADDFYRPAHGRVFEAMIELTSPVNRLTKSSRPS